MSSISPSDSDGARKVNLVLKLLRSPSLQKAAVAILVLIFFLLLSAYMLVSQMAVREAVYLFGQPVVESGAPFVARVGLHDVISRTFIPNVKGSLSIQKDDKTLMEFEEFDTGPSGLISLNYKFPELAPGYYHYHLVLEGLHSTREVDIPIEVVNTVSPWFTPERPVNAEVINLNDLIIELHLRGGKAPGLLGGTVFVRVMDSEGNPVKAKVKLSLVYGLLEGKPPGELSTDRLGLTSFQMTSLTDTDWKIKAETLDGRKTEVDRSIKVIQSQFLLSSDWTIPTGSTGRAGLYTTRQSGNVYVDIYDGERWAFSYKYPIDDKLDVFPIKLPNSKHSAQPRLFRIVAYAHPLVPGIAQSVMYVLGTDQKIFKSQALTQLLDVMTDNQVDTEYLNSLKRQGLTVETLTDKEQEQLARFLIELLPQEPIQPTLLLDSEEQDRATLKEVQKIFKARANIVFVLACVLVFSTLVYYLVFGYMVNRRARMALAKDGDWNDEEFPITTSRWRVLDQKLRALLQLVLVFSTLILFFIAVYLLLQHI